MCAHAAGLAYLMSLIGHDCLSWFWCVFSVGPRATVRSTYGSTCRTLTPQRVVTSAASQAGCTHQHCPWIFAALHHSRSGLKVTADLIGPTINLENPQTLIWTISAWAFLPASMIMRGIAMGRIAADDRGKTQTCLRKRRGKRRLSNGLIALARWLAVPQRRPTVCA